MSLPVIGCVEVEPLGIESSVLLGVCVLLMVYLGYALLRPEKF
jgi:K+-transporting ATPase KdpF subunit